MLKLYSIFDIYNFAFKYNQQPHECGVFTHISVVLVREGPRMVVSNSAVYQPRDHPLLATCNIFRCYSSNIDYYFCLLMFGVVVCHISQRTLTMFVVVVPFRCQHHNRVPRYQHHNRVPRYIVSYSISSVVRVFY